MQKCYSKSWLLVVGLTKLSYDVKYNILKDSTCIFIVQLNMDFIKVE